MLKMLARGILLDTILPREKIVMPNESIHIILAPLKSGKYEFFGDFHQDTAQGFIIVND